MYPYYSAGCTDSSMSNFVGCLTDLITSRLSQSCNKLLIRDLIACLANICWQNRPLDSGLVWFNCKWMAWWKMGILTHWSLLVQKCRKSRSTLVEVILDNIHRSGIQNIAPCKTTQLNNFIQSMELLVMHCPNEFITDIQWTPYVIALCEGV